MTLKEAIYKRKSTRGFERAELSPAVLNDIKSFAAGIKPLYDNIRTETQIVGKDKIKSILPWKAPHNLIIFSEAKDGCYENVGFMYQQLDLYIQSLGLGCCWIGLGKLAAGDSEQVATKPSDEDLQFAIFITFGKAKNSPHRELSGFKRKSLSEISDRPDERLEAARLAPSGKNAQPWYFLHEGDYIHATIKGKAQGKISRIDVGCALAHLYIENPDTFEFFREETPKSMGGHFYIGSFRL